MTSNWINGIYDRISTVLIRVLVLSSVIISCYIILYDVFNTFSLMWFASMFILTLSILSSIFSLLSK